MDLEPQKREAGRKRAGRWAALLFIGASVLAALAAALWIRGLLQGRISLARLAPEDRQRLVHEAFTESPPLFQAAWFEPRIGYTLRPGGRISAWNDRFSANALGYRSHPPKKKAGTYRVVFLGDSWTFGMGIRWRESFPMQLEILANRLRPQGTRIEAWTLALPGYNTLNEVAALEHFWDRLEPDAVVLCPTPNDIDSSNAVTPEGVLARSREGSDDFGDPYSHRYLKLIDAPGYFRRWRIAFGRAAELEHELGERRIPFFVYFAATWNPDEAHALMEEGGLNASYAITPPELTVGEWRNPPPFRHGTPAANRLYARCVYALMAPRLGWPALLGDGGGPASEAAQVFASPAGAPHREAWRAAASRESESLPFDFTPGPAAAEQCLAPMDCDTGIAPKASGFVLRRKPGAASIVVTLERLPAPTSLYPLPLEVSVADDREAVRGSFVLHQEGPPQTELVLRAPRGSSTAIEVTLLAARATAPPGGLLGRSYVVRRILQR